MGMYTEILIKADVNSKNLTKEAIDVLSFLFSNGEEPDKLPDHYFFTLPRWHHVGRVSSFYHHPNPVNDISDDGEYIFSRSDFKNYDGEIEAFFDWFRPLTSATEGKCIGYSWYEENDAPTLIFK